MRFNFSGLNAVAKRILDLLIVLVLTLPAALVVAVAAIAIRSETSGPALFRQRRIGRDGHTFICYKLRTMDRATPEMASHEIPRNAVTRVGASLRRAKLDELPQLWNVFWGEMSIVGPRPCLPTQRKLIECRRNLGVQRLRPGITGLAQVTGIDMSNPEQLAEVDAQYVKRANVLFDLQLMLLTLWGYGYGDRVRI